ncbi:MAG TPA: HPF/RaiA family ribosome-associated protein [Terracidiphilus sp.]|nr:HPF/RaiA family ribosome-associated protein [Terracidiphilus sp.]
MKIQVNSDKTIATSAKRTRFVEEEVGHILRRHARRLTRVEVHLSDIDNVKKGQADKRCLVEARPAGARPRTASALATTVEAAVTAAAEKMQRALGTYFGRMDRQAATKVSTPAPVAKRRQPKKQSAHRTGGYAEEAVGAVAVAEETPAMHTEHSRAKKRIYQARRKPWPTR